MVQGPTFLSLPARSGADWYLKYSSQYKRSAGRNLGGHRHGTPLWHQVQRYHLLVPMFCFSCVQGITMRRRRQNKRIKKRRTRSQGVRDFQYGGRRPEIPSSKDNNLREQPFWLDSFFNYFSYISDTFLIISKTSNRKAKESLQSLAKRYSLSAHFFENKQMSYARNTHFISVSYSVKQVKLANSNVPATASTYINAYTAKGFPTDE